MRGQSIREQSFRQEPARRVHLVETVVGAALARVVRMRDGECLAGAARRVRDERVVGEQELVLGHKRIISVHEKDSEKHREREIAHALPACVRASSCTDFLEEVLEGLVLLLEAFHRCLKDFLRFLVAAYLEDELRDPDEGMLDGIGRILDVLVLIELFLEGGAERVVRTLKLKYHAFLGLLEDNDFHEDEEK